MYITDFMFSFSLNGKNYVANAATINRDLTDGAGNHILAAQCWDEDGNNGVCHLTSDWKIKSLFMH